MHTRACAYTHTHTHTHKLLLGAALFGTGWGLGGFCPGPALLSLGAVAANVAHGSAGATAAVTLFLFTNSFFLKIPLFHLF